MREGGTLPVSGPRNRSSIAGSLPSSGSKSDVPELAQSTGRLDPLRHNSRIEEKLVFLTIIRNT